MTWSGFYFTGDTFNFDEWICPLWPRDGNFYCWVRIIWYQILLGTRHSHGKRIGHVLGTKWRVASAESLQLGTRGKIRAGICPSRNRLFGKRHSRGRPFRVYKSNRAKLRVASLELLPGAKKNPLVVKTEGFKNWIKACRIFCVLTPLVPSLPCACPSFFWLQWHTNRLKSGSLWFIFRNKANTVECREKWTCLMKYIAMVQRN